MAAVGSPLQQLQDKVVLESPGALPSLLGVLNCLLGLPTDERGMVAWAHIEQAHQLYRISCIASAGAHQLYRISCSASAVSHQLERISCSASAGAHQLERISCIASAGAHQL